VEDSLLRLEIIERVSFATLNYAGGQKARSTDAAETKEKLEGEYGDAEAHGDFSDVELVVVFQHDARDVYEGTRVGTLVDNLELLDDRIVRFSLFCRFCETREHDRTNYNPEQVYAPDEEGRPAELNKAAKAHEDDQNYAASENAVLACGLQRQLRLRKSCAPRLTHLLALERPRPNGPVPTVPHVLFHAFSRIELPEVRLVHHLRQNIVFVQHTEFVDF